jgi:predicted enzyme related to lactoylglutathione lyase
LQVLDELGLGRHSEVRGRNTDPVRHMVGLTTYDITTDRQRLNGAGGEFAENPRDFGQLRIATPKDPEGNRIQLL